MSRNRDGRKGKRWSYTARHYPFSVRVYERTPGGVIYAAVFDPRMQGRTEASGSEV